MTAAEAVANGAQLLDEAYPGWYKLIDTEALDIECGCHCICGQLGKYEKLFGWATFIDKWLAPPRIKDDAYVDKAWADYSAEHGFLDIYQGEDLVGEWKLAIQARLNLDNLATPSIEKEEAHDTAPATVGC